MIEKIETAVCDFCGVREALGKESRSLGISEVPTTWYNVSGHQPYSYGGKDRYGRYFDVCPTCWKKHCAMVFVDFDSIIKEKQ